MADQQYATELLVSLPAIKSGDLREDVQSVLVEQDINQPDMCTVSLSNELREFSNGVKIGDPLKVHFGRIGGGDTEEVFCGEVVAVEPRYSSEQESVCVVRAFDRMHRLVHGRKSNVWEDVSEATIITDIAGNNGLGCETDIDAQLTHVYQHNQTDMEFLLHRAKIYNATVFVENSTLKFLKRDHERDFRPDIVLELKAGAEYELKQFSPRMSANDVVSSVEVRGWDPVKKEEIVHVATPENSELGHGRLGQDLAHNESGSFGKAITYGVDSPVFDIDEAKAKAESLLYDAMMGFITGTGVCVGRSALGAGQVVEVKLYEKDLKYDPEYRFNGRYLLTGVSHRYTREKSGNFGGYQSMVRFMRDAHQ